MASKKQQKKSVRSKTRKIQPRRSTGTSIKFDKNLKLAESVMKKLQKFYGTLPLEEQRSLASVLNLASRNSPKVGADLFGKANSELIKVMSDRLVAAELGRPSDIVAIGPTITTVTITTTVASHPIITCD